MDTKKTVQITEDGLEALKNELKLLVGEKRPALVERLANARSQGDLAENSDYSNAKDELEFLDGRIDELEDVLKKSVLVDPKKGVKKGEVVLGTKVTVKNGSGSHTFHIVGEWEADPSQKKISHTSPLGQALLGKKVGEKVEVEAPAGKIQYQVLEIN
jgi:transcription elongation factor GreA